MSSVTESAAARNATRPCTDAQMSRYRIESASAFNRQLHKIHDRLEDVVDLIDELDELQCKLHQEFKAAGVMYGPDDEDGDEDNDNLIQDCMGARWTIDMLRSFLSSNMLATPEDREKLAALCSRHPEVESDEDEPAAVVVAAQPR